MDKQVTTRCDRFGRGGGLAEEGEWVRRLSRTVIWLPWLWMARRWTGSDEGCRGWRCGGSRAGGSATQMVWARTESTTSILGTRSTHRQMETLCAAMNAASRRTAAS
jgi:hypothetical protein